MKLFDFRPERRAGTRLPGLRAKVGIAQREFRDLLAEEGYNVSQPKISHIERGHYLLTQDQVAKIAKVLKVRPSVILDDTDDLEVIEIRALQDDYAKKIKALQKQRDKLRSRGVAAFTDADRERYAELEGKIGFNASMIRLYEAKINSLAQDPEEV